MVPGHHKRQRNPTQVYFIVNYLKRLNGDCYYVNQLQSINRKIKTYSVRCHQLARLVSNVTVVFPFTKTCFMGKPFPCSPTVMKPNYAFPVSWEMSVTFPLCWTQSPVIKTGMKSELSAWENMNAFSTLGRAEHKGMIEVQYMSRLIAAEMPFKHTWWFSQPWELKENKLGYLKSLKYWDLIYSEDWWPY